MWSAGKIVVVSQHYVPDPSTTANIMTAIAEYLALDAPVMVLSGMPGSAAIASPSANRPQVVEVKNRIAEKGALLKRAISEFLFTARIFMALLRRLRSNDVVITVTAPFVLPYAVAAAARLRGARSVLILHDLYPDVLVMAGLLRANSIVARAVHAANSLLFRALDAVITIGRDTENLLLRYRGMTRERIHFIPNWATIPPGLRPIDDSNRYRRLGERPFLVGLSGNLGFTHDPMVVFEAARLLQNDPDIGFLLSGWGTGFERLRALQADAKLANVTVLDRVPEQDLAEFLASSDVWIIPYRKNAAGVSVPSRFYNLLAVGRAVVIVSEPNAEAATIITDYKIGWVVPPDDPVQLAAAIKSAVTSGEARTMGERAVMVAEQYNFAQSMARYRNLIYSLQKNPRMIERLFW